MSDRMTSIHLPSVGATHPGWAEYGRKTPEEMIAIVKRNAARDLAAAQAILDADPEDFLVATYVGHYVRNKYEVLQEGKTP